MSLILGGRHAGQLRVPGAFAYPVAPGNGKQMFGFETFGNERFWTDALRIQQGVTAAGVPPIQALKLGLVVDTDAIDAATLAAIALELKSDLAPANAGGERAASVLPERRHATGRQGRVPG